MRHHSKKVLLIGADGLAPNITENLMEKGLLPNLLNLSQQGYYSRLATLNPPQSPVVWTSIATGCTPCEHGVYDFIGRKPDNYLLYLSISPLEKSKYISPIKTKTFWEHSSENNVRAKILRWPLTFPAGKINGSLLAGLGVPDIQGRLSTYTFYTTDATFQSAEKKGRIIKVDVKDNRISTRIIGPAAATFTGMEDKALPVKIEISDGYIKCSIDGKASFTLYEGMWSEWIQLRFNLGFMRSVNGICRFFLKSIKPDFSLYATPVNIADATESFPIAMPLNYIEELRDNIGLFATLGMPEDTNALNEGALDEEAFLKFCNSVMDERERMLFHELKQFDKGIFACVFDTTDRIQHMFWRLIDTTHPMYDEQLSKKYGSVINDYYKRIDRIIGDVMARISSDTLLMICSDHGFSSFKKVVHLNTWLIANGFMKLKDGQSSCSGLFDNVDWNNTKAYALGLNSIYLNIKGREGNGIVKRDEAAKVKHDLNMRLKQLTDNGKMVIKDTYDVDCGTDKMAALVNCSIPDIVVGYESEYRQSWQTALGGVPSGNVFEENLKKWSGDHCCDAEYVPGVFFSNDKSLPSTPTVLDIAPAIIDRMKKS